MIKMVKYENEYVPEGMCTFNKSNQLEFCSPCGDCPGTEKSCDNCIVQKVFDDYAKLTGQTDEPFDAHKTVVGSRLDHGLYD